MSRGKGGEANKGEQRQGWAELVVVGDYRQRIFCPELNVMMDILYGIPWSDGRSDAITHFFFLFTLDLAKSYSVLAHCEHPRLAASFLANNSDSIEVSYLPVYLDLSSPSSSRHLRYRALPLFLSCLLWPCIYTFMLS